MSRKHFRALADALRTRRPPIEYVDARDQWLTDVYAVADVCAAANGRFDRGRFLSACNA